MIGKIEATVHQGSSQLAQPSSSGPAFSQAFADAARATSHTSPVASGQESQPRKAVPKKADANPSSASQSAGEPPVNASPIAQLPVQPVQPVVSVFTLSPTVAAPEGEAIAPNGKGNELTAETAVAREISPALEAQGSAAAQWNAFRPGSSSNHVTEGVTFAPPVHPQGTPDAEPSLPGSAPSTPKKADAAPASQGSDQRSAPTGKSMQLANTANTGQGTLQPNAEKVILAAAPALPPANSAGTQASKVPAAPSSTDATSNSVDPSPAPIPFVPLPAPPQPPVQPAGTAKATAFASDGPSALTTSFAPNPGASGLVRNPVVAPAGATAKAKGNNTDAGSSSAAANGPALATSSTAVKSPEVATPVILNAAAPVVAVNHEANPQSANGGSALPSSAPQADTTAHPASNRSASAESAPTATSDTMTQSWAATSTPAVHSAQLIQAMHQSEMRMGMNSAEFGNISITASVSHQTLMAQISLDHAELSKALTAHLPGIQEKLGSTYGLQSRVEVRDGSGLSREGSSQGESNQRRGAERRVPGEMNGTIARSGGVTSAATPGYLASSTSRLDILI